MSDGPGARPDLGAVVAVPLPNGATGLAQVVAATETLLAVVVVDYESAAPPAATEPLRVLFGGIADLPVIELFPREGCPFPVIRTERPLVGSEVVDLGVLDWSELGEVIYWRGYRGFGEVAERTRREFDERVRWAGTPASSRDASLSAAIQARRNPAADIVSAQFDEGEELVVAPLKALLGTRRLLGNGLSALRALQSPPWVTWRADCRGRHDVLLDVAGSSDDRGTTSLLGDVELTLGDGLVLLSSQELERAWSSEDRSPPAFREGACRLEAPPGRYLLRARARSTRRFSVYATPSDEVTPAGRGLITVRAPTQRFDPGETAERIADGASPRGRQLLRDFAVDPRATWDAVRRFDPLEEDTYADAVSVARELVRRFAASMDRIAARLKERGVYFQTDPLVFAFCGERHVQEVETAVGERLPPVVRAFFELVDTVDFRHPDATSRADPIVIDPLLEQSTIRRWDAERLLDLWGDVVTTKELPADRFDCFHMSRDHLAKLGESGGEDYLVVLSRRAVDPVCLTKQASRRRHSVVDYLRLCAERGGFPGARAPSAPGPTVLLF